MDTAHAIDTALVYLDKVTVSGVSNVLSLANAINAVLEAKKNLDAEKEAKKNGTDRDQAREHN